MSPGFFVGPEIVPPHPSPLPQGREGEREPIGGFSEFEFGWIFQVDGPRISNSVGSLSLGEWARVRVLLLLSSLRVKVEHADTRQQISLGQIRMLMPAQRAIHQPMAILNIEG
jgi:hypothetical protein